ncbi:MAG: hypothetical protein C0483_16830 [Pirellula sp.]|nr:hypothetical protein [Pirellula sp.]
MFAMKTTSLALALLLTVGSAASGADWVLAPSTTVQQRTVYYSAPTAVATPVTSYYAPAAATPVTSYYPPANVTSYYGSTVVTPSAVPVTSYYAPSVAVPVTSYYAPTTAYYAPTAAYYAPTTAYYAPTVVARPGVVRSKVYYPYEPVRNFFKAVTP